MDGRGRTWIVVPTARLEQDETLGGVFDQRRDDRELAPQPGWVRIALCRDVGEVSLWTWQQSQPASTCATPRLPRACVLTFRNKNASSHSRLPRFRSLSAECQPCDANEKLQTAESGRESVPKVWFPKTINSSVSCEEAYLTHGGRADGTLTSGALFTRSRDVAACIVEWTQLRSTRLLDVL